MVRRQVETGLDIIDDGEFGKTMWSQYVRDRLEGIEGRGRSSASDRVAQGRDRDQFPGFYAWAAKNASLFGYMDDAYFFSPMATSPVVTGPLCYRPEAVRRDIAADQVAHRPGQEPAVRLGRDGP